MGEDQDPAWALAGDPMVQPITPFQLSLLQFVAKHPGVDKDQLSRLKATAEDLKSLVDNDMIREREPGRYRVAHFGGSLVLRRG